MKVTFVEPIANFMPVRHGFYFPNNGILALAAYLERYNYEVSIVDPYVQRLDWNGVLSQIKEESPDVIGISGYTYKAYNCMATAELIKEYFPNITTVLGGIHFSAMPEESLRICNSIDYIVIGEGELTFLELIRELEKGKKKEELWNVKGLAYMVKDEVVKTPPRPFIENIDSLPIPAYHLLPIKNKSVPLAWSNTIGCTFSRGCAYKCKFCSSSKHWGNIVRRRSAEKIVDELGLLVNKFKKNAFVFGDDDFLYNKRENIKFLEELEKRNLEIKYTVRTRVDEIIQNRDLLPKFKKSGLISTSLGIERFNQADICKWRKNYEVGDVELAIKYLKEAEIPLIELYLILGLPDDNRGTWENMLNKIKELKQNIFFVSLLTPLPGTILFKELYSKIEIWDYRRYDFMHGIISTKYMSVSEMESMVWKEFFIWWLMPKRLINSVKNFECFKFYIYRLLMHIRGLYKYMQFLVCKIKQNEQNEYALTIEEFFYKHIEYIGKKPEQEKDISLLTRRWGFIS